jgi:purine-binding chemotaxis protein CheW
LDSTASNAEQQPAPESPERKTLVFRVGNALYACDIASVREIVRFAPLTRIPGAPPFVRGLLNVRGEVLTVLDLGVMLRADTPPIVGGGIVVVETGGRLAGLVVEEVIGVEAVVPDPSAAKPAEDSAAIVRPMGHLGDRVVLYLDVPAFVSQSLV